MKLSVHCNVEPVGVEPDRHGSVPVEGVSEPPEGGILMVKGGSERRKVFLNRRNVSIECRKVLVNHLMPCCC